ncbi:unnamed protein product [Staurois parvus]|uniref:Uncharacterized protein n=1 Tax=Staurois parvus TaxID=386267 RepID=A0ABN9BSB6_9NEOB|nr:unnamed protein product [Staurois parvus]
MSAICAAWRHQWKSLLQLTDSASYMEKASWLEEQVMQLVQLISEEQSRHDLKPLIEAIECIKQKVTAIENYKERIDNLENQFNKYNMQINLHKNSAQQQRGTIQTFREHLLQRQADLENHRLREEEEGGGGRSCGLHL